MKIGILTSSRADFGIYLPLLKVIKNDKFFQIEIIAFGTHVSKFHGYTIDDIKSEEIGPIHHIATLLTDDDEASITTSYGLTIIKFAEFYKEHSYDLVFCLGDRFEMNAAVQAGIPFGIKFAHIHGGETTLGAIDNIYRHQITLASTYHFATTDEYVSKIEKLIGENKNIFYVGSLSLSGIQKLNLLERTVFLNKFNIPNNEYVLATFHPETVNSIDNKEHVKNMAQSLEEISKFINVVVTMPNADTNGSIFRKELNRLNGEYPERIILIENFGKINYFSAMKYCKFLLGNSSSGIIEAASFGKYVVNIGNRQKGRAQSNNIINANFSVDQIVKAANEANSKGDFEGNNIYKKDGSAEEIVKIIKKQIA